MHVFLERYMGSNFVILKVYNIICQWLPHCGFWWACVFKGNHLCRETYFIKKDFWRSINWIFRVRGKIIEILLFAYGSNNMGFLREDIIFHAVFLWGFKLNINYGNEPCDFRNWLFSKQTLHHINILHDRVSIVQSSRERWLTVALVPCHFNSRTEERSSSKARRQSCQLVWVSSWWVL